MRKTFFVGTNFKYWETCFRFVIEKADTFQIVLQGTSDPSDADEMLNTGKKEFLSLPDISIAPYEWMADSIKVTGELERAARELFLSFLPSEALNLWCFTFLQGDEAMLHVADFTDGFLYLEDSEIEALHAQGVEGLNELEIASHPTGTNQSDSQVIGWSKDELSSLVNHLKHPK